MAEIHSERLMDPRILQSLSTPSSQRAMTRRFPSIVTTTAYACPALDLKTRSLDVLADDARLAPLCVPFRGMVMHGLGAACRDTGLSS